MQWRCARARYRASFAMTTKDRLIGANRRGLRQPWLMRLAHAGREGVALAIDLAAAAQAEAGEQHQRRAPALDHVLRQCGEGEGRQQREGPADGEGEHGADEPDRRGAELQRLLLVPLAIELTQPRRRRR